MSELPVELTDEQLAELALYADGQPRVPVDRPNRNLIRRNLLTRAPASGFGAYRITEYGLAALGGSQPTKELPICSCGKRKANVEIEGRVLVCEVCAADEELREWAKKDWR